MELVLIWLVGVSRVYTCPTHRLTWIPKRCTLLQVLPLWCATMVYVIRSKDMDWVWLAYIRNNAKAGLVLILVIFSHYHEKSIWPIGTLLIEPSPYICKNRPQKDLHRGSVWMSVRLFGVCKTVYWYTLKIKGTKKLCENFTWKESSPSINASWSIQRLEPWAKDCCEF